MRIPFVAMVGVFVCGGCQATSPTVNSPTHQGQASTNTPLARAQAIHGSGREPRSQQQEREMPPPPWGFHLTPAQQLIRVKVGEMLIFSDSALTVVFEFTRVQNERDSNTAYRYRYRGRDWIMDGNGSGVTSDSQVAMNPRDTGSVRYGTPSDDITTGQFEMHVMRADWHSGWLVIDKHWKTEIRPASGYDTLSLKRR
jgi:hypothetical protein